MSRSKYPPDGPSRRAVWILILTLLALLIANIVHQVAG